MTRRDAVTLIEVLVSIFIMGVGLLAILTLFPLGALTMAQAIKDDRCAQAAANAEAIAVFRDVRHTFATVTPPDAARNGVSGIERVFFGPAGWPELRIPPERLEGPSYPVYIDPFGMLGLTGPPGQVLGAYPPIQSLGIPRRNVGFVGTASTAFANALRWFSLQDEIEFDTNGIPKLIGNQVQREPQYTWAYMLRRPKAAVAAVVDVSIVVYSGRPLQLPLSETAYGPVTFDVNSNEVEVRWDPATEKKPPVRKGGWVLDATVVKNGVNPTTGQPEQQPDPHGFFYRVVNVTDLPDVSGRPGVLLELETRPRLGTNQGVLVAMEYVAEVIEKAGDWKP